MKVNFTKAAKEQVTIAEAPIVKRIIEDMKELESAAEVAKDAARIISGHNNPEILQASAEIAKNSRAWDALNDGTRQIDIWLTFTAYVECDGFYKAGAYLSDVWQSTGENAEELKSRMYIRHFPEARPA